MVATRQAGSYLHGLVKPTTTSAKLWVSAQRFSQSRVQVQEQDVQKAQKLASACNEHNARIRDAEPQAYGFFATVPSLLNTKAALEEISYALDTLKADGVTLLTRYDNDNHYLGHPDFIPIWDALNARKAVVFIHPTHAVDTILVNKYRPQPAYDYPHETGRTAVDLIYSNMLRNHASNCKIFLSHAGGDCHISLIDLRG